MCIDECIDICIDICTDKCVTMHLDIVLRHVEGLFGATCAGMSVDTRVVQVLCKLHVCVDMSSVGIAVNILGKIRGV